MQATHYISTSVLAIIFVFAGVAFPSNLFAQSAESQCETPDFQITSDNQVYAITGQSFSYYVVTDNNTSFELSSVLPTGLNFTGGQVVGTPQSAGDYTLEFSAGNDCGVTVDTVNLTVVASDSAVAQGSADQSANVGLNEIPDTGLEADSALTISFYILALLAVAGWFTRRVYTPAVVSSGSGARIDDKEDTSFSAVMRGSFIPKGQSIISESVRSTQPQQQPEVKKTETTQNQTTTRRFGDGIRRP